MSPVAHPFIVRVGLAVAFVCVAGISRAEEPVAEFLRAAQLQGYGEVALDYLEGLHAAGRLPKDLAETYDLELSRSYRIAVTEAFNAAEAEARLAKAQTYLDKFLKEHPEHPAVARAVESWGEISLDRAVQRLRLSAGTKDATQKEKHRAAARADLADARTRFADATARYLQRFQAVNGELASGDRPRSAAARLRQQRDAERAVGDAEFAWLESRFKTAQVDFYTGQTYLDRTAAERTRALKAAAEAFDSIFQSYRESLAGLHAHMWHGRAADELGQDRLALDIYDEVLATSPDGRERETGLEPLFAQVQYYRLLVVARTAGPDALLAEAVPWLQLRNAWRRFDGYQGVALEVAKANLKIAEGFSGQKKTSRMQSALAMLADISRVRGEHQQEAILLRRDHTTSGSHDPSTVTTFDEAFALGDQAVENQDWVSAVADYARALELRSTMKDEQRVADAASRLDQARYQLAAARYGEGKFEESLSMSQAIVNDRPTGQLAPTAASLSVSAALSIYAAAAQKKEPLARVTEIANDVIRRWPDKAEADDARIALGQIELVRGNLPAAIQVFENVNPRSLRYASALFLAGQTHWRRYLAARRSPAAASDPSVVAERDKARDQLRASLEAQRKETRPEEPLPRQLLETQLLLAEVAFDSGQMEEAAELTAPLVDWIRGERPMPLDNTMLRVFLTSARADAARGQGAKAAATAALLAELGPDEPTVNAVAISILQSLGAVWKQAQAEAIEARADSDGKRLTAAEADLKASREQMAQLIDQIAPRKQHSPAAMIYIADTCGQLGKTDRAGELYQSILAQADADPAFQQAHGQALTRIQAQLVGLLRQKKQFAEGLEQVNKLIERFPNALEPKMEKGRLLQDWSDVDPAHIDEAVAHWTMLRTRLARAVRKPPEYYEVIYNAALCLYSEGLRKDDDKKALQAEQLLGATLVLSPRLDGPENVAKYKELLGKARVLQNRPLDTSAR